MLLDMVSSKLLRELARLLRPCAVKKLMALSRAELTLLPVANLFWVCVIKSEVCCNCSRFARTPAERTMSDILRYLSGEFAVLAVTRVDPVDRTCNRIRPQTARKSSWLISHCLFSAVTSVQFELEIGFAIDRANIA